MHSSTISRALAETRANDLVAEAAAGRRSRVRRAHEPRLRRPVARVTVAVVAALGIGAGSADA